MDTKVCSRCEKDKDVSEFRERSEKRNGVVRNGLESWCIVCHQEYSKAHYQTYGKNPNVSHASYRAHKERRKRNREWVLSYLQTHPCVDCGEVDIVVLDFDHRNPEEKVAAISAMVPAGVNLAKLEAEVAKCDVRCANCHRRRTAKQRNWWGLQESKITAVAEAPTFRVGVQIPPLLPY